jgi:hypothetical protein
MKSLVSGNKVILEFELGEYDKDMVDLLTMMEIASKSKATEREIEELSKEIKKNWWKKNKDRFINNESTDLHKMKLSNLPPQTIEKIKSSRWDRIIE